MTTEGKHMNEKTDIHLVDINDMTDETHNDDIDIVPGEFPEDVSHIFRELIKDLLKSVPSTTKDIYRHISISRPDLCPDDVMCPDVSSCKSNEPRWRHIVRYAQYQLSHSKSPHYAGIINVDRLWQFPDSIKKENADIKNVEKKLKKILGTEDLRDVTEDENVLLQDYITRNKIQLRGKKFLNGYDKNSEIYLPREGNPLVDKEMVLVIDISNDKRKKKLGKVLRSTEIHGMTDIVRLHKKGKYDNHLWSVLGNRYFTTDDDIGSYVIRYADICDYPIVLIDYEYNWKKEKSSVETVQKSTEKIIEEQIHVQENPIVVQPNHEKREIGFINEMYVMICALVYQISKTMFDNIYVSLKTSQIIILGGTNGIGKNKIIELIARLVSKNFKNQFYVMPVGPEFHDSKTIMVKYNAAKDKYEPTPLLDMLSRALKYIDEHHFFIFDEGNIAHPEQYAAAILSAIETLKELPLPAGYTIETKYGVHNDKIRIPKNISFIFTVNMDETTHKLAPKTIDRAIFIDMSEIGTEEFFDLIVKTENFLTYEEVEGKFADMFKKYFIDDEIRKYERAEIVRTKIFRDYIIKNRSKFIFFKNINEKLKGKSLRGFAAYRMTVDTVCYMIFREKLDSKDLSEDTAMDFIMIQKILPMIKPNEGSGDVLKFLREFSEENDCLMSVEKIDRMIKGLNENDFTEFCR